MSIILNPVDWKELAVGKLYYVNQFYLQQLPSLTRQPYLNLLQCQLKVISVSDKFSYTSFTCVNKNHLTAAPVCNKVITIEKKLFDCSDEQWQGNLLVETEFGDCHACGLPEKLCWLNWTGHLICLSCVITGKVNPPFHYGFSKDSKYCCYLSGCGSEKVENLFNRAVEIYNQFVKKKV